MLNLGMIEERATGWEVKALSMELYLRLESVFRGSCSEWAGRISREKGALLRAISGAVGVFEAPWGLVYLDEYEPRWKVSAHGVFWRREVVRDGPDALMRLARAVFEGSEVLRIEVPLLGPAHGVERVLARTAFVREGVLRKGGVDGTGHVTDKTVWSILREEVTRDGK